MQPDLKCVSNVRYAAHKDAFRNNLLVLPNGFHTPIAFNARESALGWKAMSLLEMWICC